MQRPCTVSIGYSERWSAQLPFKAIGQQRGSARINQRAFAAQVTTLKAHKVSRWCCPIVRTGTGLTMPPDILGALAASYLALFGGVSK